ncbi:MAG: nucleotidyltransferase family protein [Chloroflexota bacterium]
MLDAVAASGVPDAWVGAGVIRDVVWDTRFGAGFDPALVKDVDVVFFDADDLSRERDAAAEERLRTLRPDVEWDGKNQAAVHTWFAARFGTEVEPLMSVADGVGTWPDTATAVAVRKVGEAIELIAPLGLDDLLEGVWRRNPARVTLEEWERRVSRKEPAKRWPGVRVIGG